MTIREAHDPAGFVTNFKSEFSRDFAAIFSIAVRYGVAGQARADSALFTLGKLSFQTRVVGEEHRAYRVYFSRSNAGVTIVGDGAVDPQQLIYMRNYVFKNMKFIPKDGQVPPKAVLTQAIPTPAAFKWISVRHRQVTYQAYPEFIVAYLSGVFQQEDTEDSVGRPVTQ